MMKAGGFEPIVNWPSSCFNKELTLKLMVYVDDFKLAGPEANMAEGWRLIQKAVDMETPQPIGHFLGCTHEEFTETLKDGTQIRGIKYNAESFLREVFRPIRSVQVKIIKP